MERVEGRVAVVTGGANGIGAAMGRCFAEHGMSVMLADVQRGPLDDAVGALRAEGFDVAGCVTDVTKLASVEHLADETVCAFGARNPWPTSRTDPSPATAKAATN